MDLRNGDTVASVAVIRETRQAVTDAEMNGGAAVEAAPQSNVEASPQSNESG